MFVYKQLPKSFLRNEDGFVSMEMIMTIIVVAVILAAIIFGASMMTEKNRQNTAQTQVMGIIQKFRSLYYAQSSTGNNDLTASSIKAGVFTNDMVAGTTAVNPWDGAVTLTGAGTSFILSYGKVPQKSCIDLITKHAGTAEDLGLQTITLNDTAITLFPISPDSAATACQTENTIKWQFRMRG